MKKLLMGSISLCLFSLAMILFQMSCKKDVVAQASSASTQINKIVYYKYSASTDAVQIYTAKYDGTAKTLVNISLPTGIEFDEDYVPKLSPDGTKVFFTTLHRGASSNVRDIYVANIDGTNLTKIIESTGNDEVWLGGAY
jgi:Tol biopolymer transport system component